MMKLSKRSQNLFCFTILLLAVFVFIPRFWEPTAETWRYWAFARILRETDGFPVFSEGPLYILYLQLFSFFKYPLSFQIEFLTTHIFCVICVFLMLKRIVNDIPALLLTCAFLPAIMIVQGTATVAGIGFVALYLARNVISSNENDQYISLSLGAAALCHSAYIPFFGAHAAGVLIKRFICKRPIIFMTRNIPTHILPLMLKTGLIGIIMMTILFQSRRWDNSHMMMSAKYAPVPMDNALEIAFFQIGNYNYVKKTMPEADWLYQDWYFTHEKAFGGAKTVLEAVTTKPEFVTSLIAINFKSFFQIPTFFLLGGSALVNTASVFLMLLAWCLVIVGVIGIIKRSKIREQIPLLITLSIGTISVIVAMLLTSFNVRYTMTLLPIALFVIAYIDLGFKSLGTGNSVVSYLNKRSEKLTQNFASKPRKETISLFPSRHILFGIIGMVMIVLGLFVSKTSVNHLSSYFFCKTIILPLEILIFISFLLIAAGTFIVMKLCPLWPSYLLKQVSSHFKRIVVLFAIALILVNFYTISKTAGFTNMFSTENLLNGSKPVSLKTAHQKLLSSINHKTSILALEDIWIKAFADVDLNQVYNVFELPPFLDASCKTEKFLSQLDVIWVSNNWTSIDPAISTNYFLRYQLHIKPFLERETSKGNWTVEEVNGFGKIYKRKSM